MSEEERGAELSDEMGSLLDSSRSTSEAFSIVGTELVEVKAMLMTLLDLQKSALYAAGVSESEIEANTENLLEGYRRKFLSALSVRIREAAEQQ